MIFTIGHTENYNKLLQEEPNPTKLGRDLNYKPPDFPDGYPGGSVWETKEEAQKYCPEGYSVYGILADWDKDTVPCPYTPEGNERSLLTTSKIVSLRA